MPRQPRSWAPQLGAHVISRFVDRRFYLLDDEDRRALHHAIAKANHRWDWTWLSYAMMSSHVHYGFIAGLMDPDRFFQSAHTRFARHYHRRAPEATLGPVFADRPALHVVERAMLARLVAYHHRNPVSAGVVALPRESMWTSHRAYLRLDPAPPWLDVERALDVLGFRDTEAGRRRFDDCVNELDLSATPWPIEIRREPGRGRARTGTGEHSVDWSRVFDLARDITGLVRNAPLHSRGRSATLSRRLVSIFATQDLGQTYAGAAHALGMSVSGVHNLVARTDFGPELRAMLDELRKRWREGVGDEATEREIGSPRVEGALAHIAKLPRTGT